MKKIFTLLFLVLASLTAMAQEKTVIVTQLMTTSDNSSASPLARENQTVILTKNEDGTWDLTMKTSPPRRSSLATSRSRT